MRIAKCQLVSFGVESGSQEILNAMRKGTTVSQNETAIMWARAQGKVKYMFNYRETAIIKIRWEHS